MVWLDAMGFDRIHWNGVAGASIFEEASGQGYVMNKVELVSLASKDAPKLSHYLFYFALVKQWILNTEND